MQDLILSNERLKLQANEKERVISQFTRSDYQQDNQQNLDYQPNIDNRLSRDVQKETEILHARLRDIAQAIINDDQVFTGSVDEKLNSLSCTSPRSRSPVKRPLSGSRPHSRAGSPFADATLSAVQSALNKRALQIHELKTKLDNTRETNVAFKRQLDDTDNERRKLEQLVGDLKSQLENLKRSLDDTTRERDQSKQQLDSTNYEKTNLEKIRQALTNQAETLRIECEKLQSANAELQRHRDQLEDEKDDIIKDKLRQIKENERWFVFFIVVFIVL
jgi:DNA repair exonuclease SbcCD ATPase subunit